MFLGSCCFFERFALLYIFILSNCMTVSWIRMGEALRKYVLGLFYFYFNVYLQLHCRCRLPNEVMQNPYTPSLKFHFQNIFHYRSSKSILCVRDELAGNVRIPASSANVIADNLLLYDLYVSSDIYFYKNSQDDEPTTLFY